MYHKNYVNKIFKDNSTQVHIIDTKFLKLVNNISLKLRNIAKPFDMIFISFFTIVAIYQSYTFTNNNHKKILKQ